MDMLHNSNTVSVAFNQKCEIKDHRGSSVSVKSSKCYKLEMKLIVIKCSYLSEWKNYRQ